MGEDHLRTRRLIALPLIVLVISAGCARNSKVDQGSPRVTQSHAVALSEHEVKVGRQIHEAILSAFRVYTEPRLVEYVKKVGQSVAKFAGRQDLPYQFTVLYDDRIYATSAPGGFVYITTGFLNFLQNEAELSAVLAHEVAELQYRDPRFSNSKRALGAVTQAGALAAPFFGQIGALAALALMLLNSYAESEGKTQEDKVLIADQLALNYLVQAQHDPQGYLDLLNHFLNLDRMGIPHCYDYLTSRPVTVKRYQWVLNEFGRLPLSDKSFNVNREGFLEMTRGVREIYQ